MLQKSKRGIVMKKLQLSVAVDKVIGTVQKLKAAFVSDEAKQTLKVEI